MVTIKKLTNANVYFDGVNYVGKVEEANLPSVDFKQVDHKVLGMFGVVETPTGIDKLSLKLKWSSILADVLKKVSKGFDAYSFQVRSSLETFESGSKTLEEAVVGSFRGRSKNIPSAGFKQHENVDAETDFALDYYKLEIGGETIFEIDVTNNIYIVDGVDQLATYRANLGLS